MILSPAQVAALSRGPLTVADALDLCTRDYLDPEGLDVVETLRIGRVRTSRVRHRGADVLVCRGTTLREQWFRFNLMFWPRVADGDTRRWHRGFLAYSEITYAFAKGKPIDAVVGHSLGAAAAQIVGASLGLPTIALASPQPLYRDDQPAQSGLILNVCRRDDLVCALPPSWWGFLHVGALVAFDPAHAHRGEDHRTTHYRAALDGSERGEWRWVTPPQLSTPAVAAEKAGVA